jgi:hypothetical protein
LDTRLLAYWTNEAESLTANVLVLRLPKAAPPGKAFLYEKHAVIFLKIFPSYILLKFFHVKYLYLGLVD